LFGSIYTKLPLDEDRYIKAVEDAGRWPRARKVVHHALTFTVPRTRRDPERRRRQRTGGNFSWSTRRERTPSCTRRFRAAGAGRPEAQARLPSAFGREDVDAIVEVGFVFHPKGHTPKYVRWSKQLGPSTWTDLDIPGGENRPERRLHALQQAGQDHGVPAAHAHPRQIPVQELIYPTSGTPMKTEVINCAHSTTTGTWSNNYKDDAAPMCRRHDSSYGQLARQLASNKFTRSPRTGSAMAAARLTKWASPGLGGYDMTRISTKRKWRPVSARGRRSPPATTGQQQP